MTTSYGDILWQPTASQIEASCMARFAVAAGKVVGKNFPDYASLYLWSTEDIGGFWQTFAELSRIRFQKPWSQAYVPPEAGRMLGAKWFVGGQLNFAENLLQGGVGESRDPSATALIAHAEGVDRRAFTWDQLKILVAQCAASLKRLGVGPGDRVAGVLANTPEAVIAMLGTTALGAIWSSCSPDFGVSAVVDRLGQVAPKVLFYTAAYQYGGKLCDTTKVMPEVVKQIPGCQTLVLVPPGGGGMKTPMPRDVPCPQVVWEDFLSASGARPELHYEARRFEDPLFIMFSSGTTGVPKCMVHSVGGTLLQHKKEHLLHCDLGSQDRIFYYTTCGWMMWNWMVSALAVGASLVTYDGAVGSPQPDSLWRLVHDEKVTVFGTSPKYLSYCMSQKVRPSEVFSGSKGPQDDRSSRLGTLKTILATGSPLLPEHGAWVYQELGRHVHLASISGGTDIISCFMLGHPGLPVRAGEIQCAGLGMAIEAWDEAGNPVTNAKGELVCTKPFPSMPVGFWNDPDGRRYKQAYFDHFRHLGREVWRHGDYVQFTPHGGVVVYGRSDATLNPGGVRIGTAEIYRAVESLAQVLDSVAVGRREGDDTPIVLFVKLRPDVVLDQSIEDEIRRTIRSTLTPRHVPRTILQVKDIPYTRSGKKVEMAVTQAIHGEPVSNLSALANPEAMEEFFALGRQWSK